MGKSAPTGNRQRFHRTDADFRLLPAAPQPEIHGSMPSRFFSFSAAFAPLHHLDATVLRLPDLLTMKFLPLVLACLFLLASTSCSTFPRQEAETLALNKANDIRQMANYALRYDHLSGHGVHDADWKRKVEANFKDKGFAGVVLRYKEWDSSDCDWDTEYRDVIVTHHGRHRKHEGSSEKVFVPTIKEEIDIRRSEVIYAGRPHYRYRYKLEISNRGTALYFFFLGPEIGAQ